MLIPSAIAQLRLQNQQIASSKFHRPEEIVAWHGAMQAQDYQHAKWAVGLRLPQATETDVEQALSAGTIVRTHIMRPTWHLVAAADIRWLMALTAPQIHALSAARHRELGLDAGIIKKSNDVIASALEGGRHRTRQELAEAIERAGIEMNAMRMVYIMFSAELDALVCNGLRRGKEHTYALLDERVPLAALPDREESLARLAQRYFQSHAPATLADFTWWSGLRAGDARLALTMIKPALDVFEVDRLHYWIPKDSEMPTVVTPSVHLLPAFDEFMVSYKDRSASLDASIAAQTITGNGIFKPIIVVDGRVAGLWNRTEKKTTVAMGKQLFTSISPAQEQGLQQAAERFGHFLGKTAVME